MKVVKDTKESKKVENRIIAGLASEDEAVVIKTISYARQNAEGRHLGILIQLLRETKNENISNEIIALLNDLKDQGAMEPMMDAVLDDANIDIRVFLLQAIWNSRLDAVDFLEPLVNLAIKSDFVTCLECLTIIENFENAPSDEAISAVNTIIKDALMDNSENKELLMSMMEVLNDYMIG
ncbi:MAG: hypothetical protein KDC83_01580 [Flavobacteriales bacterium]|nr:hypothetical protein [Flavobacteriales bacterium]